MDEASRKVLERCGMTYVENNPTGGTRDGQHFETMEYVIKRKAMN